MRFLAFLVVIACSSAPETPTPHSGLNHDTENAEDSAELMLTPPNYTSAEVCGECHPRQYTEWRQSMHSYAAVSPVFEAMNAKAFRDSGGEVGTFCTGCHAPIGTELGEGGHTAVAERSELSKEGITCSYCHSAVEHDGPIGNNNILNDPEGPLQGPFEGLVSEGHASEKSDFIQSPEFCGSCHDVFSFPALRIEEAFTEYKESPAAEQNIRCQDCHMGPNPGTPAERPMGQSAAGASGDYPDREMASHFFSGPDYSMLDDWPYPGDPAANEKALEDSLARTQQLLENAVEIGWVVVHRSPNETRVEINLKSKLAGHGFPTGFTSERQAWVQVTVKDKNGRVRFESGDLDYYGDLRDSHSREVREGRIQLDNQLVNFQSKNLLRQGQLDDLNVIETVFPFDADWVEKQNLGPLEERNLMYWVDAPAPPFTVEVSVNYRNLPPYLLRALQLDELVSKLQIFEIDKVIERVE